MTRAVSRRRDDVTVVVPCFNYGDWLWEALLSLVGQTCAPGHIVVVDDGSTDDTAAVADRFAVEFGASLDIRVIRHPQNLGFVTALETGFAASDTALIAHIDADDRVLPRYIELLAAALDAHPAAGFAYPLMRLFGDEEGIFYSGPFEPGRLVYDGNFIPHIAMFRRQAFLATRGYRNLPTHVDWDLWLSFLEAGHPGVLVEEVLYEWRRHAGSMTHQPTRQRLRVRLNVLWNHRGLLLRHAVPGIPWFVRSLVRRLRVRLPHAERLGYARTASCWIDRRTS
jgi:glycosyltransferase involved in cell wall biosynthesis